MSSGFPPPNDPFLSAFTLLDEIYAEGPVPVDATLPTDVAISRPLKLQPNAIILVIASAIFIPGAGCSGINLGVGLHHQDGSGGSTLSNLGPVTATAGNGVIASRMYVHNPVGAAWADATYRMAITQTGAPTAGGNAYGVGIAVLGRPY